MTDFWSGIGLGSGIVPTSQSAKDMRQRIALAMLMKKGAIPKNLGEGIFSVGDSLGDAITANRQVQQADAQSAASDAEIGKVPAAAAGVAGPRADAVGADDAVSAPAKVAALPPAQPGIVPPTPPQQAPGAPVQPPQAASGFRPPPQYLASSLERLIPDPERRGYLGHLAGREAQNPNEVSSTGAAGPFQFTRGTGAQYGIPGNDRFDVDKSIVAANRLTDDNAAVLAKALGRAPSPGELALAHQQGAGTAAKMLLGSGNASASNLAVNNVPGGLGPQAAAQKIMSYYGMPGSGGPRDNAAAILASRQTPPAGPVGPSDVAQEATMSDVMGSRAPQPPFAPTASNRAGDVQSDLPPVTGAVSGPMGASVGDTVQARQETLRPPQGAVPPTPPPGPQVAQAPQPSVFPPVASDAPKAIIPGGGFPTTMPSPIPSAPPDARSAIRGIPDEYVPKDRPQPEPPSKPTMGPVEQQMNRQYMNRDIDPRIKAAAQQQIDAERAQLNSIYENKLKNYEIQRDEWKKEQEQNRDYRMKLPYQRAQTEGQYATTDKTKAEIGGAQAKSDVEQMNAGFYKRTGQEREPFLKSFGAEKEQITKVSGLLRNAGIADDALRSGKVASGWGAPAQLVAAQIGAALGSNDAKQIAYETEKHMNATKSMLSYGTMLVNGKDPRITEGDVKQAEGITGTPEQQLESKKRIIAAIREDLHGKVSNYEDMRDYYLKGDPQHRMFEVPMPKTAPDAVTEVLIKHQNDPRAIEIYDSKYGPGAADLEIRRARRKGSP
jgi:hypothetical protein